MAKQYRALTESFLDLLHNGLAWPKYGSVEAWFRKHHKGIKTQMYTRLRNGEILPDKYAMGFADYLLARGQNNPEDDLFLRCCAYFESNGWPSFGTRSKEEVLDRICTPPQARPPKPKPAADTLKEGIGGVLHALINSKVADDFILGCTSPSEVEQAVEWFFIEVGRQLAHDSALPMDQAIAAAEKLIQCSLSAYQRRAVGWWEFNPWTVVLARGNRGPVGMTIQLPLSAAACDAVTNSCMLSYDCTGDDLEIPSTAIFFEALASRPRELGGKSGDATRALAVAGTIQTGALMHRRRNKPRDAIRWLTIGAVPENTERAKKWGFVSIGRKMHNTDLDLYELKLTASEKENSRRLMWQTLLMFGEAIYSPPPTHREER